MPSEAAADVQQLTADMPADQAAAAEARNTGLQRSVAQSAPAGAAAISLVTAQHLQLAAEASLALLAATYFSNALCAQPHISFFGTPGPCLH